MVRKLVVEAIGTFFLVLTIGLIALGPGAGGLAPVPVAGVLVAMVYAGGHISGAHYNPAVTLGVFLRGQATVTDMVGYWVVQLGAGALAAVIVRGMTTEMEALAFAVDVVPALIGEFLFTFALVFVVLNVATARGTRGNSYFGVAIGLTVLAAAYAIGGVSGGAINPAVAQAFVFWNLMTTKSVWVVLIAELLGGVAAALLFNGLNLGEDKPTTATLEEQGDLRPQAEPSA